MDTGESVWEHFVVSNRKVIVEPSGSKQKFSPCIWQVCILELEYFAWQNGWILSAISNSFSTSLGRAKGKRKKEIGVGGSGFDWAILAFNAKWPNRTSKESHFFFCSFLSFFGHCL
jgi:hypothetical protein